MRSKEPVPDRNYGGDHPEQEPLGRVPDPNHELSSRPSLTIAEAARTCGVSVSTIRRYLAAGRFPTAHQQPSPIPGQRGRWRIPTQDLLAAGLRPRQARTPDQDQEADRPSRQTVGQPVDDRVRELEHALELERTRRRAAEDLAAERAHTIQTLETALRALQAHRAAPAPDQDRAAPSPASPSDAAYTAGPDPQPGMLPMVPKQRSAKRELSQEEKAAIIGRALSRQRPPKRRWL
jgi:predicted DNA-binding transcriptional regulator AlpA